MRGGGIPRSGWPGSKSSGILAWLVRGCVDWFASNELTEPKAVRIATAYYRDESDTVLGFIDECCKIDPSGWEPSCKLNTAYGEWCRDNQEHERTVK